MSFRIFGAKIHAREAKMEEGREVTSTPKPRFDALDAFHLYGPAHVLNQDPDLWVFRRFGQLHLFNLLHLQQKLASLQYELEKQLVGKVEERTFETLIPEIKQTLAEYDAALAAQTAFRSRKAPTQNILKQLDDCASNSVQANCSLLSDGLGRSLVPPKDLASIAVGDKSLTHRFIDRHHFLRKRFIKGKAWGLPIYVYSEAGVRFAEEVFINASFCFLLICPIVVLSYLTSKLWKLVFLAAVLLVASAFSGGFLNTPNRTGLALVAGYAAVLVVFISNNGGS